MFNFKSVNFVLNQRYYEIVCKRDVQWDGWQIGAFFMINLCLVVIATQFSETKRRETERMQHERALRRRHSDSSSVSVSPALSTSVSVFSTGASCYSEMFRYVEHLTRRAWRRLYTAVIDLRRRRRADVAGR